MPRPISFNTEDGVVIHGTYCPGNAEKEPTSPRRGVVLFHMMPATKESWTPLKAQFVSQGFSVLAIDLRGHGQSTVMDDGTRLDYRTFSDSEHQEKIMDVEAAVAWLSESANIENENIGLIGASIGANLAIAYASAHNDIPAVVALSPGLDYRGITTADKVKIMSPEQKLYLIASEEDEQSFTTNRKLAEIMPNAIVMEFNNSGHGTTILENHPEFMLTIVGWMESCVPEKLV